MVKFGRIEYLQKLAQHNGKGKVPNTRKYLRYLKWFRFFLILSILKLLPGNKILLKTRIDAQIRKSKKGNENISLYSNEEMY